MAKDQEKIKQPLEKQQKLILVSWYDNLLRQHCWRLAVARKYGNSYKVNIKALMRS